MKTIFTTYCKRFDNSSYIGVGAGKFWGCEEILPGFSQTCPIKTNKKPLHVNSGAMWFSKEKKAFHVNSGAITFKSMHVGPQFWSDFQGVLKASRPTAVCTRHASCASFGRMRLISWRHVLFWCVWYGLRSSRSDSKQWVWCVNIETSSTRT